MNQTRPQSTPMQRCKRPVRHARGLTLIETVIAVGVLAVMAPLMMATLAKAGESGTAARAETRAPMIVDFLAMEINRALRGQSEVLGQLVSQEGFQGGAQRCFAFGREGKYLGKIEAADYNTGLQKLGDEEVYYLASTQGDLRQPSAGGITTPHVLLKVWIEYPATRKKAQRKKIEFDTILP